MDYEAVGIKVTKSGNDFEINISELMSNIKNSKFKFTAGSNGFEKADSVSGELTADETTLMNNLNRLVGGNVDDSHGTPNAQNRVYVGIEITTPDQTATAANYKFAVTASGGNQDGGHTFSDVKGSKVILWVDLAKYENSEWSPVTATKDTVRVYKTSVADANLVGTLTIAITK